MNKLLKLLTCFVIFLLVAEGAPLLPFNISRVDAGNSNSLADAMPSPSYTSMVDSSTWLRDAKESVVFSPNLTSDSSSFTFGNTAIGTIFDQNDANAKSASSFTCSNNGQITDIYAYIARTDSSGTGEAAIYADNSGQPGALIEQSNPENIITSFSWVDFQLPTPESVTSGMVYWLSICSDDILNLCIVADSGVRIHNGNTFSEGFSNPFGPTWGDPDAKGAMSIYASVLVNSHLSAVISPTSVNIVLGGYQQFTSTVTGSVSPYSYQWYLNDTAVSGGNSQNWIFTPSAIGDYNIYLNVTDSFDNIAQSNIVTNITVLPSPYNFSIMQISDTQFLASTYPDLYNQLTRWIVNNNSTYNLKMVVHTGDIVDQYYDASQWQSANDAMTILTNNGIPYTWCAGNHDQNNMDNPNSGWVGNQYVAFDPTTFSNNSYWVGDSVQGKNSAVKFSVNGYNFLIINLECQANATAMAWATNLLNTYSSLNYNIIVATHAYLDSPDMTFNNNDLPYSPTWELNLQSLLNNYSGVFMTLNGHTSSNPAINVYNQVNGRTQIEFNDQYNDNRQGACSVRIYSFDLNTQTVTISTYSVWDSRWLTEIQDSFGFSTNLTSIPTVNITPTHVEMDLGQSQTFSSSVSGGRLPYSYQWYLNDTAVPGATSENWTFTPSETGYCKVYVNLTDSLNIKVQSKNVSDIIVYPQLTTSISPISVNMTIGNSQQFISIVTGGLPPYTYQWYFSNGTAIADSTDLTFTFEANSTGTHSIYQEVTDSLNYTTQSEIATINVYLQPSATISPTSVSMTLGATQQFTSEATGGLSPYSYQWFLNDTAVPEATGSTWNFTPTTTGHYTVYLNATDALNFQVQSNIITDITVYPQPTVTISPSSINMTTEASQTFTANVTGGTPPYSFQWYLNGTAVIGATNPNWIFTSTSTGTYIIYLNVTDNSAVTMKSNSATVSVETPMTVNIKPTHVKIYLGESQTFNSTLSGGTLPYSYQWYLNGTAVSGATSANWTFTPMSAGRYRVYLNITDGLNFKAQSNIITDITVYSQLAASISPVSTNMTVGTSQTFTSTILGGARPYTYQWYLNGSQIPNAYASTWTFTPTSPGDFIIYLTVADNNNASKQSNNATITVETPISVTISPIGVRMYLGQSQTFNSSVSGGTPPYTYQWYLNDGAILGATGQNWTYIPTVADNYLVYLNVTDGLNIIIQSNIVTDITVYSQLTVSISPDSVNMTVGTAQTFTSIVLGGAQPYTYQWYLDGSQVPNANASIWEFTPTSVGNFNIYLTVADNNTASAQSNNATITIETTPNVTISPIQVKIDLGQSQTFISTVSGGTPPYSYQWYLNDSALSGGINQNWTFTPTIAGYYKIYLNVTDALNIKVQSNIVTDITVFSLPAVSISPTTVNMTLGTEQMFTSIVLGGAQPYSYQWYLNGSAVPGATSSSWTLVPVTNGTYKIYLNVTDNSNVNAQSNNATAIVETPTNVAILPIQVKMYLGQSQTFNSSVSGGTTPYTYQWYLNDEAILGATSKNWTFTPATAENYKVYLNITDALNIKTQSNIIEDITVYPQLTASISPVSMNMTVGIPQIFSSIVSGGVQPYTYQWYLNGSQVPNANANTWTFTPTSPGNFTIYLTLADNNTALIESNNATMAVEIPPNVTITPTQVKMYLGQSQTFNSTISEGTPPYSYQWYLNDTAVSGATSQTWTYTPIVAGNYRIYLNITDAFNIKTQSNMVTDITVYSELTASISPVSVNMTVGMQKTFNSAISGGAQPYSYQWYLNGTAISGANGANWIFTPTTAGTYNIYLNVTDNNAVIVKSNNATANVEMPITVNVNPTRVKIYLGQNQTFNSSISGGTLPYTYQWYLNDIAVIGATNSNWTFIPISAGSFRVYLNITDSLNFIVQSNIVTDITVYSQLIVSINPVSVNMTVGTAQTFNSTVSGGAQPYIYQWYLNGSPISNGTESSWTFTPTSSGNFTIYLTVTDNNTVSAQSNNATITIGTISVIMGFIVQSGGSDYTTPAIIITGGGGTGATATARVSNGVIISIVLTNPGSGYTSTPTISIRDPSPRAKGASATAVLSST